MTRDLILYCDGPNCDERQEYLDVFEPGDIGWYSLNGPGHAAGLTGLHFCSLDCLAAWTKRQIRFADEADEWNHQSATEEMST